MQVSQFILQNLTAHAELLLYLSRLIGEEKLLQLLESRHLDLVSAARSESQLPIEQIVTLSEKPFSSEEGPLKTLETAVESMNLSEDLENYLWCYPLYRSFIESSLELDREIDSSHQQFQRLIDESMMQAKIWMSQLMRGQPKAEEAMSLSLSVWLRFRGRILKSAGISPFQSVK